MPINHTRAANVDTVVPEVPHWDGRWIALWPLSMVIGVWGTGMVYHSLARGAPTFWVGLALFSGGMLLSGRWIAQARRLRTVWRKQRTTDAS